MKFSEFGDYNVVTPKNVSVLIQINTEAFRGDGS